MKKLTPHMIDALRRGEQVALAVVTASSGSTPRKAGSVMAAFSDGTTRGTVGGGALEYEAQFVVSNMLQNGESSKTAGYSLSSDETGDVCMICGGDVYLHYFVVTPADLPLVEAIDAIDRDAWLILHIAEDEPTALTLYTGSTHDAPVELQGRALLGRRSLWEEATGIFTLPLTNPGHVYIFGGGHIGRELVPALTRVGFACVVYDDREEYAKPESFPGARVICADFNKIAEHIAFTASDYVVIVTRGHKNDYAVMARTLPSAACYVGCIGSKRKMAILRQRLRDEAGLASETIARLVSPIGIEILSETPEEIAVSITAQLILHRAGGQLTVS